MPTIVDVKKALEAVDGGSDLVAALDGELSKLRTESGKYRTRAKTLADHIGVDLSVDDLEGSLADIKAKDKGSKKGASDEHEARLQRLEADLKTERDKSAKAEQAERTTKARSLIKDALTNHKAIGADDLLKIHMSDVKFREDGTPYFTDANGAERSVDEHVKTWIKERPGFQSSEQKPGPGGFGNNKPVTTDLSKLNPETRLELAFGA